MIDLTKLINTIRFIPSDIAKNETALKCTIYTGSILCAAAVMAVLHFTDICPITLVKKCRYCKSTDYKYNSTFTYQTPNYYNGVVTHYTITHCEQFKCNKCNMLFC